MARIEGGACRMRPLRGTDMNLDTLDWRKLVAELVGTFALIFIGAGAIIMGASLLAVAFAHGLVIALMVSALGHISGGLFNPALTLGLWVTRRLDHINTIAYIVTQFIGAIAGAVALFLLFPETMRDAVSLGTPLLGTAQSMSDLIPGIKVLDDISPAQGVGIELLLTFFLMLAVFGTALDRRGPSLGGFGIGSVITMDILAGGLLTGAAMNPARALGPALIGGVWDDHFVYWVGPIAGAVLGALLYHFVFMDEEQRAEGMVDSAPSAVPAT